VKGGELGEKPPAANPPFGKFLWKGENFRTPGPIQGGNTPIIKW